MDVMMEIVKTLMVVHLVAKLRKDGNVEEAQLMDQMNAKIL
jgi:hypothetical protein